MDADARTDSLDAVKRKLNVTWESDETDNRLYDVVETVSAVLGMRLGYGPRDRKSTRLNSSH